MAEEKPEVRCGNCFAFNQYDAGPAGSCRLGPPRCIPEDADSEIMVHSFWPEVQGDDWCTEFRAGRFVAPRNPV